MELHFVTALTIGFLGSTHCVGMCGGIVGALNAQQPDAKRQKRGAHLAHHLAYNAGRITSYVAAGAMAGLIGAQAGKLSLDHLVPVGTLVASLFLIALGLYLGGWWRAISSLENAGQYLWKWIRPLGQRFLPVRGRRHAFGLGLVWGWLPCGLVYSALALALISASPADGAWLMFGFGLGTLPMLLVMGKAAEQLSTIARRPVIRQAAGVLIILFGAYTGYTAIDGHGHHHPTAHHAASPGEMPGTTHAASSFRLGNVGWTPSHGSN